MPDLFGILPLVFYVVCLEFVSQKPRGSQPGHVYFILTFVT